MSRDFSKLCDEELVALAKAGDSLAEEFLIREYKDTVRGKAHFYFIVGADSEDIVQEGMIGIFRAIKDYDPAKQASFRTFAELCVNRQILTAIRAANRRKHTPLNSSVSISAPLEDESGEKTLADTIPDGTGTPEELLIMKEGMDYIEGRAAEDIFSEMELMVWNEYLKGKAYTQIAEELGKSPKTIDNAIQRTKRKLMAYLDMK